MCADECRCDLSSPLISHRARRGRRDVFYWLGQSIHVCHTSYFTSYFILSTSLSRTAHTEDAEAFFTGWGSRFMSATLPTSLPTSCFILSTSLSRTGHAEDAEIVLLIDAPLLVPASFHGATFHDAMEQNHLLIPSFVHI
jgi:hypothetical protein